MRTKFINKRSRPQRSRTYRLTPSIELLESRIVLDSTVVFNEVMYNPLGADETLEWIELHNQLALDVDLTGWSLRDGIEYEFPDDTVVPADGYLVVAAEPAALQVATGFAEAIGPYSGSLSNGGETIELLNNSHRVMDVVDYRDGGEWPVGPDGSGATLAKIDEQWSAAFPANWRTSTQMGGTPGARNFPIPDLTPITTQLVDLLSDWRYEDSGTDLGTAWRDPSFDDSSWVEGQALFHAGEEIVVQPELGLRFLPITSDADSGIDDEKVYTHALDFGSNDDVAKVNGVSFHGVEVPDLPTVADFSYEVSSGIKIASAAPGDTNVTGEIEELLTDYITDFFNVAGGTATITISGLTVGAHYDTRLYTRRLAPDTRNVTIEFDTDGIAGAEESTSLNQDDASVDPPGFDTADQAYAISYDFIADNTELVITITQEGSNKAFNLFGLTNEVVGRANLPVPIDTLFSTGIGADGLPLSPGASDPHWFVTDTGEPLLAMSPHPAWVTNSASSQWAGIVSSGTTNVAPGQYSFSTQFDLSSYNASTAVVTMLIGVDDSLVSVELNGSNIGISTSGFASLQGPFSSTDSFLPGINTLEFTFSNGGATPNPSGLQVQFDAKAIQFRDNTEVAEGPPTHYFRREFEYNGDPRAEHTIEVNTLIDDGAVIYLNGQEVIRQNMPAGPISFATPAAENISIPRKSGRIEIPSNSLVVGGSNVLAVELHQANPGNPDVLYGAEIFITETPVAPDAVPSLRINEMASALEDSFWLELRNDDEQSIDVGDYVLQSVGSTEAEYAIPAQLLAPGEYLVLSETDLGFASQDGDRLFLQLEDPSTVVDARKVTNRLRGRSPQHDGRWLYPNLASPGADNVFRFHSDIVINEIMYHPSPIQARPAIINQTTLLPMDGPWRYNPTGANLGADWQTTSHAVDGSNWLSGVGPLGVERSVLQIPLGTEFDPYDSQIITYYFEQDFTFSEVDGDFALVLEHLIDDGAVFYLNGVEVLRFNMAEGDFGADTLASGNVSNARLSGTIVIPSHELVVGTNRLSAEVHQRVTASSDIVFGAEVAVQEILEPAVKFREPDDSWIELLNRGSTPVDLTNWEFTDGIGFAFEPDTVIQPNAYLVVAQDINAFQEKYPEVRVAGEYSGQLSRFGERIELTDQNGNPADEVHYYEGGRWPTFADGGGSSLELRDPAADNSQAEAWAASIESNNSLWETIRYRGSAVEPPGSNNPNVWQEFIFGLLDNGEVLVDDVSVIEDPDGAAVDRIQNGSFDAGTDTWRLMGNHGQHNLSDVVPDPDDPSNRVLHLVATSGTEHMSNHVETTFADGASIVNGREYEISMRVRWLAGSPQLHTRLYFNRLAQTTILPTPDHLGTPGQPNSMLVQNIGPTYEEFHHLPVIPQPALPVPVSVRASDPDGVSSMTLWYSVDDGPFRDVAMSADADGTYRGTIPGQDATSIVQFYVEGRDTFGATSMFPAAGPESRALYKVNDSAATAGPQHNFRLIMTEADTDFQLREENRLSNHRLGATVVFNETQVYYDIGSRLKGSGFSRGSAATGYNLRFNPEQLLFGVHDVVAIDRQGGPWGIGASHRELTLKHIGNRAGGIPMMYDDAIQFLAPNPGHNGTAQLLAARYDNVFLDSQFENGSDGTRFKFDLVYYSTLTQNGDPEGIKRPPASFPAGVFPVLGIDIRDLGDDPNSYRWNFLIRNRRPQDDFSQIVALGKALSLTGSTVGSALDVATQEVMDVDQWMRTFAFESLVGINDTYNQGLQHNLQFYVRPSDSKVIPLPWDMDFSFHHSTSMSIYGTGSNLRKVINIPSNQRLFQGHLLDIINTTYNVDYLTPWVDHIATRSVQDNTNEILNYVTARRNFVLSRLLPAINFEITTGGGNDFEVAEPTVTLDGNGWIDVREIRLAGDPAPLDVSWTDNNSWQLTLPLAMGANPITLEAYDFQGDLISSTSITVTSTTANPIAESLRISELNYHPHDPTFEELAVKPSLEDDDFEFIEFTNIGSVAINLANTRFTDGINFTFPAMELAPGQSVVAVGNSEAFQLRYGEGPTIAGQYDGSLSNGGERLTVVDGVLGETVMDFEYNDNDPWPELADGNGATLQLSDVAMTPADQLGKHYRWRASTEYSGTPGEAGQGPVGVVVNEVFARTDLSVTHSDSIELHNTTASRIDIGGWFLSDSASEPLKYRISDDTLLEPGSYIVFDENDFNPNPSNPGPADFALSGTEGDDVIVTVGDGVGGVAQFVDEVHFGASRTGETLGRIPDGSGRLTPTSRLTLGCGNSGARVGPLVITEIQYAPGDPSPAALAVYPGLTSDDLQYIEIHNPTNTTVDLTEWRVRGGADFDWDPLAMIGGGETVVILSFNPDNVANADRLQAFLTRYSIDESVPLRGGFSGRLNAENDRVVLQRPDDPPIDNPSLIPRLTEDEALYDNLSPWPTDASGSGNSIHRTAPVFFENSGASWTAGGASPGTVDFAGNVVGDMTGDGLVTAADIDVLFDAVRAGSEVTYYDLDNSGAVDQADVTFLVETNLGTSPGDANLDGSVDGMDFNIWNDHRFQACNKSWANGDFSGDGAVDGADFNIWLEHRFTAAAAVHAANDPTHQQNDRPPRAPVVSKPAVLATDQVMAQTPIQRTSGTRPWRVGSLRDAPGSQQVHAREEMKLLASKRTAKDRLSTRGAVIQNLVSGGTEDRYLAKNVKMVYDNLDQIFSTWGL